MVLYDRTVITMFLFIFSYSIFWAIKYDPIRTNLGKTVVDANMPPWEWYNQTDYLTNYSFIFPFENSFDRREQYVWYRCYGIPICYTVVFLYLITGFIGEKIMANRDRFDLRTPLSIFNFALSIFSVFGLYRMTGELFRTVSRHGVIHSVCISTYAQDHIIITWMKYFIFSKYAEFIDTWFLILRKRPVSALHWYHHSTVPVMCWHGMYKLGSLGRWFFTLNFGMHSVMYAYYGWRSMGYSCPRWICMSITSMQISQMAFACFLAYTTLSVKISGGECHMTWENVFLAFAIYGTYYYLFARYFYFTYMKTGVMKLLPACMPGAVFNDEIEETKLIQKSNQNHDQGNEKDYYDNDKAITDSRVKKNA